MPFHSTPLVQYPLYSASIQLYGGQLLPYNLKEEAGWGLDLAETRRTVKEARWGDAEGVECSCVCGGVAGSTRLGGTKGWRWCGRRT